MRLCVVLLSGLLALPACVSTQGGKPAETRGESQQARSAENTAPAAAPETTARHSRHAAAASKSEDVRKVVSKDGSFTGEVVGTPAPKSKFAKLVIGMSRRQVEDLIGTPSDMKTYQTGKGWIPVAGLFSRDQYRLETYYKSEGRLVFAQNGEKLFRIQVDTRASGYQ